MMIEINLDIIYIFFLCCYEIVEGFIIINLIIFF